MNWKRWWKAAADGEAARLAPSPEPGFPQGLAGARAGKRARLTQDSLGASLVAAAQLIARPSNDTKWRSYTLDQETFDRLPVADLMELCADLSPDISLALYQFLRMCNPGWEARALRPETGEVDERAQAALDLFLDAVRALYGSPDVPFNRLFVNAFLRGGLFAEVTLDAAGRTPIDLVVPDAATVQFELTTDKDRGQTYRPFQQQGPNKVYLDVATVRYVPVDPFPGSPYGRSLATPSLFTTIFSLAMLHDIRRVVQQQGWPRIDLAIDLERLLKTMPGDLAGDPKLVHAWIDKAVTAIQAVYDALQPDDAYIHTDVVTVNRPVGTVDSSSLGAVGGLIEVLERQQVRALKSAPFMFGLAQSTTETMANRQYEVAVQGIKSLQHFAESLLEHLFTVALQAQGVQATVKFRFAELRASEMLRDAQVEQLQIKNAALLWALGYISQDEAAQRAAGVEQADAPEPRADVAGLFTTGGGGGAANPMATEAEPGSNRRRFRGRRVTVPGDFPALPEEVEVTEEEIDRAVAAWDEAMEGYGGLLEAEVEEEAKA